MAESLSKYYFSTKDLATITILGALGGGFSVYMGYIIAEIFNIMKVWFPVGESLSGVHLIWIVLVLGITNKKGSGVMAGLLKGCVEFLMGSRLGIFVVVLSLLEGLFAELGFWPFRKYRKLAYIMAGGIGTASNVVTFQLISPFQDMSLFALATFMAFISGAVFAGILSLGVVDSLEDAGILRKEKNKKEGIRITATKAAAILVGLSMIIMVGSVVFMPPQQTPDPSVQDPAATPVDDKMMKFTVTGSVNNEKEYNFYDHKEHFVVMESQVICNPHKLTNYTGLPLKFILEDAGVKPEATKVDIVAWDSYYNTFDLSKAMSDDVIMVDTGGQLKIIANGLSQEYWVGMIKTIRVY
ncbi:sulfite oxidase [Methanocella sp. CWC-04]|uniref:Sulfite oxidase n=1 Tax=Methanooceanicella nereidis TaxID=2052831 RepID=A0AAP2RCI3_9EURY|nr:ECF transporter S component [Methanocella sp. CWC-04]MCD1295039.1 sulfite oxidase [Methanocella sp. CWC-04]